MTERFTIGYERTLELGPSAPYQSAWVVLDNGKPINYMWEQTVFIERDKGKVVDSGAKNKAQKKAEELNNEIP